MVKLAVALDVVNVKAISSIASFLDGVNGSVMANSRVIDMGWGEAEVAVSTIQGQKS